MIKPKVLDLSNTRTVPSFKPVVYNDRERLLFDPYLHKWCILYLLVLFLLVHLVDYASYILLVILPHYLQISSMLWRVCTSQRS